MNLLFQFKKASTITYIYIYINMKRKRKIMCDRKNIFIYINNYLIYRFRKLKRKKIFLMC